MRRATVYRDDSGGWRYRVRSANGRVVGKAEESFTHKDYVVERVHSQFPDAEVRVTDPGTDTDYVVEFGD